MLQQKTTWIKDYMGNNIINYMPSERIAGFKPYFFAQLGLKINDLKTKGVDIIRLDMGSPDLPPDMKIIERLMSMHIHLMVEQKYSKKLLQLIT
jgi:hypothetical protein